MIFRVKVLLLLVSVYGVGYLMGYVNNYPNAEISAESVEKSIEELDMGNKLFI